MIQCPDNWDKIPWWGHRANILHNLIPSFTSCLHTPCSHPKLLSPTYWCLSQLWASTHAVSLFWNAILPFSDWKTLSCFMPRLTFSHLWEVTPYSFQIKLFALSWSPTVLVYISIITLTTLYCGFTLLFFKIQEFKNMHLLIFMSPGSSPRTAHSGPSENSYQMNHWIHSQVLYTKGSLTPK